jgi:hypothetical protein
MMHKAARIINFKAAWGKVARTELEAKAERTTCKQLRFFFYHPELRRLPVWAE